MEDLLIIIVLIIVLIKYTNLKNVNLCSMVKERFASGDKCKVIGDNLVNTKYCRENARKDENSDCESKCSAKISKNYNACCDESCCLNPPNEPLNLSNESLLLTSPDYKTEIFGDYAPPSNN